MKGKTNNPNGRPKGSKNKVTKNLQGIIKSFLEKNADDLQTEFEKLEPRDKLLFFEKLLKFAIPTQQQNQVNFEKLSDEDLDIIIDNLK
ncbi:MAG TPA: hypothetical protein VLZ83_05485 [Edaphocola sp.]|nr:hypothetical protein [Edaphocola sp.]